MRLAVEVADKMVPFATVRRRHKIARGGRGSAKSQSIARILIAIATARFTRCLCCRETQTSIKQSTKRLLENAIKALGLTSNFDVQDQIIRGPHGSEFVFTGLRQHTSDSIKSFEGFNLAWVAEAQSISAESAQHLIPTIREAGSELWWDYNPDSPDDFVHQMAERAIRDNDPDVMVVDINYPDNPWFPDELEKERQALLRVSQDLHDHVYGGKLRSVAGVMFKRRWFKYWDKLPAKLSRVYMASDYAGAPDADNPEADPDWTEFGAAQLDQSGNLYWVDWWGDQADPDVWVPAGAAMAKTNKALIWYEEKGMLLRARDSSLKTVLRDEGCMVYRHALPSAGSKADRALGFATLCSYGKVYFPDPSKPGNEWVERVVNQLCAFTGQQGRRDDAVDVCSLMARGLDVMTEPPKDDAEAEEKVTPFTKRWLEHDGSEISDEEVSDHYR